MSNGVSYKVSVDFESKGNLNAPNAKLGSMAQSVGSLQQGLSKIGGSLSSAGDALGGVLSKVGMVSAGLAGLGAVGALAGAKLGVELNASLESAQIGLASIFQRAGASSSFSEGMKDSAEFMAKAKADAAALPGTFNDLRDIAQHIAIPLFADGGDKKLLESMSADLMVFGKTASMDLGQVAREANLLLAGHAGSQNRLGQNLGLSGDSAHAFNAKSGGDKLKELQKLLSGQEDAKKAYAKSYDGLSSTAVDNVRTSLVGATAPLFSKIKDSVSDFNDWFSGPGAGAVSFWVGRISRGLVSAFDIGRDALMSWGPALLGFVNSAYDRISSLWDRIGPLVTSMGDSLKNSLGDGSILDKLGSMVKLTLGLKAAGALTSGMSSLMPAGTSAMTSLGAGASAGPLGAGLAAVAMGSLASAALVATGQLSALADSTSEYHQTAVDSQKRLNAELSRLGDVVSVRVGPLWEEHSTRVVSSLSRMVESVNRAGDTYDFLATRITNLFGAAPKLTADPYEEIKRDSLDLAYSFINPAQLPEAKKDVKPPNHTSIQNIAKVEIIVPGAADPSQVAKAIYREMDQLAKQRSPGRPDYLR